MAYENLSEGMISFWVRWVASPSWFPSNVIFPRCMMPPNSWMSNFSPSLV